MGTKSYTGYQNSWPSIHLDLAFESSVTLMSSLSKFTLRSSWVTEDMNQKFPFLALTTRFQ